MTLTLRELAEQEPYVLKASFMKTIIGESELTKHLPVKSWETLKRELDPHYDHWDHRLRRWWRRKTMFHRGSLVQRVHDWTSRHGAFCDCPDWMDE